ncbi:hypothetical protein N7450_002689 [Penicillium hetheringtonii]|uniref:Uncharacterized protein n=1 Tax=Penicillium hetheringtonii TaxID=911720 RepID=A0AAD6GWI1_9EURO|nr:hypothetical protein N7450_002689 [Penicillium hetheringtonii]
MQQSSSHQVHPSKSHLLSLAKFSYTATPIDHPGPLSWSHINAHGDLVCALDQYPGHESIPARLIMKITRNDIIMEQIDIARFVQSVISQHTSASKSPFAVVIKCPCLAVKYPQNGSIRRFQLKFLVERDFYTALSVLSEANCPLTEGNATAVPHLRRLPSSSSWASSLQAPTIPMTNRTIPSIFHLHHHMCPPNFMLPKDQKPQELKTVPQDLPFNTTHAEAMSAPVQQTAHPTDPSSKPTTKDGYHDLQELNQVLPPKRDLPFLKPSTKRKRTEANVVDEATKSKPKSFRVNQLTAQSTHNKLERRESIMSDTSSQSLVPTQPYPEFIEPPSTQPDLQSGRGNDLENPIERLATTVSAAIATNPVNNIQVERTQSPSQRAAPILNSVQEQLSAYLASPNPERVQFLENWMCELVNDDSFMTLCEDVESTWRRFAFGVKK